jgi:hypothetical protein
MHCEKKQPAARLAALNAISNHPNSMARTRNAASCRSSLCPPALRNDGAGGGALVLPGRGHDADGLVVAGQAVDSRLDQNQAELGVLVLAVALKVLADGNGLKGFSLSNNFHRLQLSLAVGTNLLDQHVQVLRNIGGKACCLRSLCQPRPYRGMLQGV